MKNFDYLKERLVLMARQSGKSLDGVIKNVYTKSLDVGIPQCKKSILIDLSNDDRYKISNLFDFFTTGQHVKVELCGTDASGELLYRMCDPLLTAAFGFCIGDYVLATVSGVEPEYVILDCNQPKGSGSYFGLGQLYAQSYYFSIGDIAIARVTELDGDILKLTSVSYFTTSAQKRNLKARNEDELRREYPELFEIAKAVKTSNFYAAPQKSCKIGDEHSSEINVGAICFGQCRNGEVAIAGGYGNRFIAPMLNNRNSANLMDGIRLQPQNVECNQLELQDGDDFLAVLKQVSSKEEDIHVLVTTILSA